MYSIVYLIYTTISLSQLAKFLASHHSQILASYTQDNIS